MRCAGLSKPARAQIGFIDPNYVSTGQFDQASDAYSLGVVVLILLTGWRAVDSEKFIYHRCQNKDVEEVADKKAKWPDDVAKEMLEVGMGLSDPSKMTRMKMATAIEKLEPILSQQPTVGRVVERDCIACMAWPRVVRLPCGHTAWCRRCLNFALDRGALVLRRRTRGLGDVAFRFEGGRGVCVCALEGD